MTHSARSAIVLALLAALVVGSPASAQDKDSDKQLPDRIKALEKTVADLKQDLALEKSLAKAERQTNDLRYQEVSDRLARLEQALARLSAQSSTSRRAFSIDPNPRTRTGTIVIENHLAEAATVWIDGTSYRVAAMSRRTLADQSLGSIQYAARRSNSSEWGRTTRSVVRAGETLTIDVYEQ